MNGCELDDNGDVEAGNLGDWWRLSWLWRQGCKVWNPGGKPFGLIGAMGVRKPTAHLDLRAYHDLSSHLVAGRAHATYGRPLEKCTGRFAFLDGPRPATGKRNMEPKMLLWPI